MDERLDYLIGERIGEVLNEAESRRKKHYRDTTSLRFLDATIT